VIEQFGKHIHGYIGIQHSKNYKKWLVLVPKRLKKDIFIEQCSNMYV